MGLALLFASSGLWAHLVHGQTCDPNINPVKCENQLAGNPASEWDISGSGDSTIQGFATNISVNRGTSVAFKVTTTASAFNVNIYRLGYYNGMGARKVATISSVTGKNQSACLTNSSTGLIDCGNWTQSTTWAVPSTAVSGVYIAKIARTDNGGSSHIVFIVRDDASHADLFFQTSDTTWQAYNWYGGNSLYVGSPGTSPSRAYKVSYNRPFNTRGSSAPDSLFNAEYPMIRWLEANGYNVAYTTGVDSDRSGALLKNHKVFLSVGHDEYWSGAQRTNVEAARAAGVHMAFLSGNEVFWKTRWENSIDGTSTAYRTLVSYKETHKNAVLDPLDPPTWTGTWMDPRFSPPADGGRPQNALTGTLFNANCCVTATISVPQTYSSLRFWRNTRVASLAVGGSTSLSTNTLGYEFDADIDNGFRPAGLFDLSVTAVASANQLQDYGSTYAGATVNHAMTLYRHSSGALVFGAGTVQFTWGLDGNHDRGGSTVDSAVQQSMVNLFADMTVQPTTLQSGLVAATASTDTVAPVSTIVAPTAGATVPIGVALTISGTATDSGGVVAAVEVSVDGGTTWHRANGRTSWTYVWTPAVNGSFTIMSRAVDDSANLQGTPASVAVSTGTGTQVCPCTIWPAGTTPAQIETGDNSPVEIGVRFRSDVSGTITAVRFYKGTGNTGTHVGNLWSNTGSLLSSVTFSGETASGWQQMSFATPVAVTANTTYVVSYHTNTGNYGVNNAYFKTAGMDDAPLHAPTDGLFGANGVYAYGTGSTFPSQTYQSSNYWVDVVFNGGGPDVTAPTVAISAPAQSATVSGSAVTVSATASDNVGVVGLQFKLDNVNLGSEDTATPYTATWNTTGVANGSHVLTAVARDAAGNTATSSPVTVTVNNDTTPPTISMSGPAAGASVSGTAVGVSATAADNVGVAGVQFFVDGAVLGAEVTSAPYAISWNSALQPNGAHLLTARARDAAGNQTMSAPVSIAVANSNAIGIDAAISGDQPVASTTVTANGLTTSGDGELLLAFVSGGWVSGTTSVSAVSGGGLTWALVARTNTQQGTAEIWRTLATTAVSNISVTATFTQAVSSSMTVTAFTGVDTSGTNGSGAIGATQSAAGATGAPSATLSTTRNGSWVVGVGADTTAATARVVPTDEVLAHQLLVPATADTYWTQWQAALTPAAGTAVTLNDSGPTADRFDMAVAEILALPVPDLTAPAVSISAPGNGATVSGSAVSIAAAASDNVGVVGVQFALDGTNLGLEVTTAPFSLLWNTVPTVNGSHMLTATARDAAGNSTTSLPSPVIIANDLTPPSVSITAPAPAATVSGAVTVTTSTSDNVGVAGVQFKLDNVNLGAEVTTAPYNLTWSTTAASNGAHTLTAVARDAAGNMTMSSGVAVTVANTTANLLIDVVAFKDPTTTGTSLTTSTFTTAAPNELLLAFVTAADASGPNTVASVTGGGLTWQLVVRTNGQPGTSEVWRAFATTVLTNASVTANLSRYAGASLTVVSFIGADSSGTNGSGAIGATRSASATTGAPTATITTTRNGSWVFGAGNDWSGPVARTVPANQTLVHQFLSPTSDTFWVQRMVAVTPNGGTTVTINDTAPTTDLFNLSVVEVLAGTPGVDTTAPTITATTPASGSGGVSVSSAIAVTFSEPVQPSTVNGSSIGLRNASGVTVPASVSYDVPSSTAILTPSAALQAGSVYTASVAATIADVSGNLLAAPLTWSFATATPAIPPTQGSGGPILVVTTTSNPFTTYYAEILHAEGLNELATADVGQLSSTLLAGYSVVVLGEQTLTAAQATTLTTWVQSGGHLIAMRPDTKLSTLLGLGTKGTTLSDAYLAIDTSVAPGKGLVSQTMQFHGPADQYVTAGATVVATLYSSATAATTKPAVTTIAAGAGTAAAFTYDLARSVVYTRQGNPAWAGQERDGTAPIRSDDLFFGAKSGNVLPDWVDLSKVAIPQADEQQRLLANMIIQMAAPSQPLPRFWYFPNGKKAVVVMSGDDHGNGGEIGRFSQFATASPAGCSLDNWECVRGTAYIYNNTPITNAQVASFVAQGFEIALHVTMDPTTEYGCGSDYTTTTLTNAYTTQLAQFTANWPAAPKPVTHRMHCLMWSDWLTQPTTELAKGMRLDTSYYYWPPTWVNDKPGMFTGSGMPMRYASLTGAMIDVYQAVTQMTDESGQTYPITINTLLDNAVGTLGYYGAFTANMHNDTASSTGADAIVASAQARSVPVVSAKQMLTWLDGRNNSSFSSLVWDGVTLSFTVIPGSGTTGLQAMLPTHAGGGVLTGVSLDGVAVTYTIQTIKGVEYALLPVRIGRYAAVYAQ